MKLFAKTEYACIAVLELARHYQTKQPLQLRKIADEQGIPQRFLVQIMLQLKGAGLVVSARGAGGGYRLAKSPEKITLAEVLTLIEGDDPVEPSAAANTPTTRVLLKTWQEFAEKQRQILRGISFAKLLERSQNDTEQMYYI